MMVIAWLLIKKDLAQKISKHNKQNNKYLGYQKYLEESGEVQMPTS